MITDKGKENGPDADKGNPGRCCFHLLLLGVMCIDQEFTNSGITRIKN